VDGGAGVSNKLVTLFLHQPSQSDHFCELGRIGFWNRDFSAEAFRVDACKLIGVFQHLEVEHRNLLVFSRCTMDGGSDLLDHDSSPCVPLSLRSEYAIAAASLVAFCHCIPCLFLGP
jgi:hypothetical protein